MRGAGVRDQVQSCDRGRPPRGTRIHLYRNLDGQTKGWLADLTETLEWVQKSDVSRRESREFQHKLWEDNRVAAVGQGNISLDRALDDASFRTWFAQRSVEPLPSSRVERSAALAALYDEIAKRLDVFCKRTPHLKIFRVLAALYPGNLTTIADRRALRRLYNAMGGPKGANAIGRHMWILDRLEESWGAPGSDLSDIAERIAFPWMLYAHCVQTSDEERTEEPSSTPGESKLVPLPAARRRRGLTPVRGLFPSLLSTLEFTRDGVTREELLDFLRAESPDNKESSLGVTINSLQGEFGVLRRDGDQYLLTERGESVLESQDPSDLADWLLTHILGVDTALFELRDRESLSTTELTKVIQSASPSWTSLFVPRGIINWLRSLGVIESRPGGMTALTDVGREWAARIHWIPESLPSERAGEVEEVDSEETESNDSSDRVKLPAFTSIYKKVSQAGRFAESVVAQLHAGIWAHPRRHFAVLTGLSGSGKTLLAREYGKALVPEGASTGARVCTISVQPGWYDPGALLGYVNPLRGDSYVRAPFLEFLLAAANDSQNPYIAILDEMNLSHPEQYMAPLLSAMETGARIDFHTEGDLFDGIPSSIRYPANLVLIGTVNMDETTHGLSDKVLDRAFTLEFWDIDLDAYPRWGERTLSAEQEARCRAALRDLMAALAPARLHFGWRVVDDVLDFLALVTHDEAPLPLDDALDSVIYAKVVPKLRGDDSPRFRDALASCVGVLRQHGLERSRLKVEELARDLESTGSARFWR